MSTHMKHADIYSHVYKYFEYKKHTLYFLCGTSAA